MTRTLCLFFAACAGFLAWFCFENFLGAVQRDQLAAGVVFFVILLVAFVVGVFFLFAAIDLPSLKD